TLLADQRPVLVRLGQVQGDGHHFIVRQTERHPTLPSKGHILGKDEAQLPGVEVDGCVLIFDIHTQHRYPLHETSPWSVERARNDGSGTPAVSVAGWLADFGPTERILNRRCRSPIVRTRHPCFSESPASCASVGRIRSVSCPRMP